MNEVFFQEIPLSEILDVRIPGEHGELKRESTHYFVIKTQNITYYIGLFVCLLVWFLIICVFIAKQFGLFLF